jgi:hypothetical protein
MPHVDHARTLVPLSRLIELSRRYRVIREPIRLIVRQWYAWISNLRRERVSTPVLESEHAAGLVSIAPTELQFSAAFDAETRHWALNVLLHHELATGFPCDDPEAKHDRVRMRGVLPALAEVLANSRSPAVGERIEFLLRGTVTQIESDRRTGWDATNSALRLLSVLTATETLRPHGLALPTASGLLHDFIAAHGPALRIGRIVEPEGNHRLINVLGRAALQLLALPEVPLPAVLVDEIALTFQKQFLHDGGHVERSPHYHAESVAIAALIRDVDASRHGDLAPRITPQLTRALDALAVMISPTAAPVRFGDISRTFSGKLIACEVAEMLGAREHGSVMGALPDFGLVHSEWVDNDRRFALVFDCGPMGFEGNPGHGHADMLSFCFWRDDHELIGDPGTFMYADRRDAMEFKLRGAHNCIDWPAHPSSGLSRYFRWRRVPPPPRLAERTASSSQLCMSADHSWRLGLRRYHHTRTWIPLTTGLAVLDKVQSSSPEQAVSLLNLHPDSRVTLSSPNAANVAHSRGEATVSIFGVDESCVDDAWYAPNYGVRRRAPVLRSSFTSGPTPSTILTVIEMPR